MTTDCAIDDLFAYIKAIVSPLLEPGDDVTVERHDVDGSHVFYVLVDSRSIRFVIGRGGKVAEAVRILVRARASARGLAGVNLQIRAKTEMTR